MMFTPDIRAMPAWLLSNRRFRLDHYLIAALSNLVYLIVFLKKFRSSLVRRSIKMPCGSAADKEDRSDQDRIHHGRGKRCPDRMSVGKGKRVSGRVKQGGGQ